MNSREVEAMVRDIVVHLGLRFTVLSLDDSPGGWNVQLRPVTGAVVQFTVHDSRPSFMRAAILQRLEAES